MNKKIDLTKYKKLARIMQVVVKIFLIVTMIATICTAIAGIVLTQVPAESLNALDSTSGSLSLTLDNIIAYNIDRETVGMNSLKPVYVSICFMAATISVLLAVIFKQLELILGTIKDDKPFTEANSRRLTIIGATLMVGAFIIRGAEYMVAYTMIHSLKITSLSVVYSADNNMILTAFIVLVLAGVFKYGSYLQQEYDATV